MKRIALILNFLLSFFLYGQTQLENQILNFESIDIEDGLTNNHVNSIFQSIEGAIWIGTHNGLNKYDGYNFTTINNKILKNSRIENIAEDTEGYLVISTSSSTMRMNKLSKNIYPITYFNQNNRKNSSLTGNASFKKTNTHNYIGSLENGLLVKPKGETIYSQTPLKIRNFIQYNYKINSIFIDQTENLWVLIDGLGIGYFDKLNKHITLIDKTIKDGMSIVVTTDNHYYIGTKDGIYSKSIKNKGNFKFQRFEKSILNLFLDSKNRLWATTDGDGLYLKSNNNNFSKITEKNNDIGLKSIAVRQIMEDTDGRFWCATIRSGILVLNSRKYPFHATYPQKLNNALSSNFFVSAVAEQDQHIYVGSDGYGIYLWDRDKSSFTPLYSNILSQKNITKIVIDKENNKWVSTWNDGIYVLDKNNKKIKHYRCFDHINKKYADDIWTVFLDSKQNIWASSFGNSGLYLFNKDVNAFQLISNELGNILCFAEEDENHLWIGNDTDLLKINKKGEILKKINFGYRLRTIYVDDKTLWVATEGGGLFEINKTTFTLKRYTEQQGMSNDNILQILVDKEKKMWLSTFKGLTKFDPITKISQRFIKEDGLQSNQFSYQASLVLSSGELLFGGIKGLNTFFAETIELKDPTYAPELSKIIINDIPVGEYLDDDQKIELEKNRLLVLPTEQFIQIEFSSFPYFSTSNITYETKLIGYDNEWVKLNHHPKINFNKLPPGKYTLQVKASLNNGISKSKQILNITILTPWYETVWAYIIYALIFVGALYFYIHIRKKSIKLEYNSKIIQLELTQEKKIAQERNNTFTELIREIKEPLTLVLNPLKSFISNTDETISSDVETAYRNAHKLHVITEQLSYKTRNEGYNEQLQLENCDITAIVNQEIDSIKRENNSINFHTDFSIAENETLILADRKKISLIIFKLYSYLIQHSESIQSIYSSIIQQEDQILCSINTVNPTITLNTTKLSKQEEKLFFQESGIGFQLIKELIELHNAKLDIILQNDIFIGFELFIPLKNWVIDKFVETSNNSSTSHDYSKNLPDKFIDSLNNAILGKVIIIDDNINIRKYIKNILIKNFTTFELEIATNAIDIIEEEKPSLVISEVFLDGSGYELCRTVKNSNHLKHIPIILMSAFGSNEDQIKAFEYGADEFVTKPFDYKLLLKRIQTLTEVRQFWKENYHNEIIQKSNFEGISKEDKVFVEKCISIIELNFSNPVFSAQELAKLSHISYSNLYKKVRALTKMTTSKFIRTIRINKAAELLINTNLNINQVSMEVGIQDLKYFREKFKEEYNLTPTEFIKKYKQNVQ
jgi:ligand-binding sensor domain-containing protein/DNA-binding response OmpR family regulator